MRREDRDGIVVYGSYGKPLLIFPAERGNRFEWENTGMIGALAPLIEEGRLKVYCVDAWDGNTWSDDSIPVDDRARLREGRGGVGA